MTDDGEIYKRVPSDVKKSRNYQDFENRLAMWEDKRWIGSNRQIRQAGRMARMAGIGERWKTTHFFRNGKPTSALRDIETGRFTKKS